MSKNKSKVSKRARKLQKGRLRLSIFKSNENLVAQIIDDVQQHTLASANSLKLKKKPLTEKAVLVAQDLADKAKKNKIKEVYYDNSNRYCGAVKRLIEELRAKELTI